MKVKRVTIHQFRFGTLYTHRDLKKPTTMQAIWHLLNLAYRAGRSKETMEITYLRPKKGSFKE